jgi:hypothetical protein
VIGESWLHGNIYATHQGEKVVVVGIFDDINEIRNHAIGEIGSHAVSRKKEPRPPAFRYHLDRLNEQLGSLEHVELAEMSDQQCPLIGASEGRSVR